MEDQSRHASAFAKSQRPNLALICNHGYAGARFPDGGAPDTGGRNLYINDLALALDRLGYLVTVFSRGGFPFFESQRLRDEPEYLTDHVRYVFVPGGGEDFIRKEDIAIALDEQLDWLDGFIRLEALAAGVEPWQVYQVINSHYWDSAVLGVGLVERWRNDVVFRTFRGLLEGVTDQETLDDLERDRHLRSLGEAPVHHLGQILLQCEGSPATPLEQRVQAVAARWVACRKIQSNCIDLIGESVSEALRQARTTLAPALHQVAVAEALGVAVLTLVPDQAEALKAEMDRVDTHVWTPHSLGALNDESYRGQILEVRRPLKFCERRDHERMVAERTQLFAATSYEVGEKLITHYRVPPEQIFYFPPCVDQKQFRRYGEQERAATWAYLAQLSGVAEEKLRRGRIVFETSRMDPTKRKDLLLQAFARVVQELEDCYLFIGGGPENEVHKLLAQQLAAEPVLQGRAFLSGFIPDEHLGPLYSIAHVYCSASELEGFGMSVSQAAAAHTAVISTDRVPFSVQYVPRDAVVVPAGDAEDFVSALLRLLDDDDERDWRAAGLAEKVKVLDWEAQTSEFLSYLRRKGLCISEDGC